MRGRSSTAAATSCRDSEVCNPSCGSPYILPVDDSGNCEGRVNEILLGKATKPVYLLGKYGNRHGLVAGATGTGKTVSLMVLAEGFSRLGVPVFMADVKGDVAGLAQPGVVTDTIQRRAAQIGITGYAPEAAPVVVWDLYGKTG